MDALAHSATTAGYSVSMFKLEQGLLKIVINISKDYKKLLRNKEKCKLVRVVKFPSEKKN